MTIAHLFGYRRPTISTHTLTWSVTRYKIMKITGVKNFNSHAHVERDVHNYAANR